jgi:hypothetical protein
VVERILAEDRCLSLTDPWAQIAVLVSCAGSRKDDGLGPPLRLLGCARSAGCEKAEKSTAKNGCATLPQNEKSGSWAAALQTRRTSQGHYTISGTFDEEGRFAEIV